MLFAAVTGLIAGLAHVLSGPDHLAAIAPLAVRRPTRAWIPGNLDALTNYFRGGTVPDVIHETYIPNSLGVPAHAALPNGVQLGPYLPGSEIPAP